MTKNGIIYAVLVIVVLMGAVIAVQHMQIRDNDMSDLDACHYSMVGYDMTDHAGYWVMLDTNNVPACAIRFNGEGAAIVDGGV